MNEKPPTPGEHLRSYTKERLPDLIPGMFDGQPDIPYFTIDQHFRGQRQAPYPIS